MSAPTTRDPLAVVTSDGAVWTRRAVSPEGRGLYALVSAVDACPSVVMATLVELAQHGVSLVPSAAAAELERFRARVAELEDALRLRSTQRGDVAHLIEVAGQRGEDCVDVGEVAEALWLGVDEQPGPAVEEPADKLTRLLAPTQALREDAHDSPLHHTYRVGRDLPETGGAK